MATPVGATLSPAAALPRLPDSITLEDLFAALDVGTVSKPAVILVDSASLLSRCVNALALSGAGAISVDLEGVNLCREGRVALLQLYSEVSLLELSSLSTPLTRCRNPRSCGSWT